jgi:flagellin-like hook-associated protein FlgL
VVGNVTSLPSFIATPNARNVENGANPSAESRTDQARSDAVRVDARLGRQGDVLASREDVAAAKGALDLFIAVTRQTRGVLLDARDLAVRAAEPQTPEAARAVQDVSFRSLLQELAKIVDGAVARGGALLTGASLPVDADPDATQDIEIKGLDLRLKAQTGEDEAVRLTTASTISTLDGARAAARAADESISRIDAGLRRVETETARLDGHDRLLSALDSALAAQVRTDFDADAARLIALQVRQELSRASSPIANVAPSSVLALFRE